MKTITLDDITQEDFDSAAQTVIAGIKAYNRKLDTRSGTVLRDLLVDPEAAVESVVSGQIAEARKSSSLAMLKEAQDDGEEIDPEDVASILSNFNITPSSGTKARGTVKIVVSDGALAYSVPEGAVFTTADGLSFEADAQVVATSAGIRNPSVTPTTKLYEGAAGYFFLVPVTASEVGEAGNIQQGTSLSPGSQVSTFVMAEAYKDFGGGSDTQSLESIIESIPSGLSIRGFVSRTASEGMLRAEFDSGDNPIVAVSSVGYGHPAQRRDRHNVFGVGVGGRIDLYVRNFTDAFTVTKTVTGSAGESDGTYTVEVPTGMFPGACWVKSVSDPFSRLAASSSSSGSVGAEEYETVLSSLAFTAERTADVSGTWHDIDVSSGPAEAFNTVWQGFRIRLTDVPPDGGSAETGYEWSSSRDFKVTMYCLPQAVDIQAYVDRDDVRSVATDVVVRCPIVCSVSVNAVVHYDPKNPIDEEEAKTLIRTHINGLGFVGRLTRSDIVQILKNLGAVSVDMPNQDMLYGTLHDALGVAHSLSGDALDISSIEDGPAMISKDTVVFAAERGGIQIKMIPNA